MDPVQPQRRGPDAPAACLIVGCGYAGTRMARALRHSRRVLALVRSPASAAALQAHGVRTWTIDLDVDHAPEDLPAAADGATIAYLAPPPETGTGDPRLQCFLAMLADCRPAALLYMSTTGVYGDTAGALVTEQTPVAPGSDRGRRRAAAETVAADWCVRRGVRSVILRVPGIYGPHRLPLERLRRGEPAIRMEEAGPGNRIHVDDLVAACIAALDDPSATGVYNAGDGDHASTTEYLLETARQANLPPPRLVSRAEATTQISPGMLAFLSESRRVDTSRLRNELGVRPRYPDFRAGIAASLAEMRGA